MKQPAFELTILEGAQFVLRRQGEEWAKDFHDIRSALTYARSLSEREEAVMTVRDETGPFMEVIL